MKRIIINIFFVFIICNSVYAYIFGQNEFGIYCIDKEGNLVMNTWIADDFDGDGYSELRHINEIGFLDVNCTIDGNYINSEGYSTTDGISVAKYQTITFETEIGIHNSSMKRYFWESDRTTTKTIISLDCPVGYITPEINIINYEIKPAISLDINTMSLADFCPNGTANLPEGTMLDMEFKLERHNVTFHRIVKVSKNPLTGDTTLTTALTNHFDWQGQKIERINGEYGTRHSFLKVPCISEFGDYDIISVVSVKRMN